MKYAQLIRLLVGRELTLRYKRSVIGIGWTLLNPVLTSNLTLLTKLPTFFAKYFFDLPFFCAPGGVSIFQLFLASFIRV
jgi:ABC-type polysaccharide/polyol phosphate export permease